LAFLLYRGLLFGKGWRLVELIKHNCGFVRLLTSDIRWVYFCSGKKLNQISACC
jgi:hypothetical protein